MIAAIPNDPSKFPGNFREISLIFRKFPGNFREISWKSEKLPGNFLEISWDHWGWPQSFKVILWDENSKFLQSDCIKIILRSSLIQPLNIWEITISIGFTFYFPSPSSPSKVKMIPIITFFDDFNHKFPVQVECSKLILSKLIKKIISSRSFQLHVVYRWFQP